MGQDLYISEDRRNLAIPMPPTTRAPTVTMHWPLLGPVFARLGLRPSESQHRPFEPVIGKTRKRRRAPPATRRPSLEGLGTDILAIIMSLLGADSPGTLSSVALVSPHLYQLARYAQHREVTIDLHHIPSTYPREDTTAKTLKYVSTRMAYIEKAGLLTAVRRLVFQGYGIPPELVPGFGKFVAKLTGLTDLVWDIKHCIPEAVFQCLRSRLSVRLHAISEMNVAAPPGTARHVLEQLHDSPNLHSLDVTCGYTTAEQCLTIIRPLRRVLISCPNLRRLKLDIHLQVGGCVYYASTPFRSTPRPRSLRLSCS